MVVVLCVLSVCLFVPSYHNFKNNSSSRQYQGSSVQYSRISTKSTCSFQLKPVVSEMWQNLQVRAVTSSVATPIFTEFIYTVAINLCNSFCLLIVTQWCSRLD